MPPKKVNSVKPKPYTRKTQTRESPPKSAMVSRMKLADGSLPNQPAASKKKTPIKPKNLKIFCVIEGDDTPFSVEILSNKTVDDLKEAIYPKITTVEGVKPKDLTLKLIKNGVTKKGLGKLSKNTLKLLDDELEKLYTYFPVAVDETRIHIIVQLPQQAHESRKRGQVELGADEGDEISSKRPNVDQDKLVSAIHAAGFAKKAMVGKDADLSLLTSKELVSVLENIGIRAPRTNIYQSIPRTAATLQHSSFDEVDYVISSPPNTVLPVTGVRDLYVRQEFKDLYDTIIKQFCKDGDNEEETGVKPENYIIVTGTAGIGKSSFLIYLAIRLLATSDTEDPPIVIIQRKEDSKCYAYGGLSSVRCGDIEDFSPFLDLPNTWFLVDSSPKPELTAARTIFSVSPKTLFSEINLYQEVVKRVVWTYYMAPWELDELKKCRDKVGAFQNIPEEFMEHLYELVGGVPRYVLEKPGKRLRFNQNFEEAEEEAYSRVKAALDNLDDPLRLLQYFEQAKDSLQYSSRLLHRIPTENRRGFVLKWASDHIMEKVYEAADDNTWNLILDRLVNGKTGEDKGAMFELYARRILRTGNRRFQARRLKARRLNGDTEEETISINDENTEEDIAIPIEAYPRVEFFNTLEDYDETMEGSLWVPKSKIFACVDMLLAPKTLLQVTTNPSHGIKSEPFKALLRTLKEKNWISSSKDIEFVFIVPQDKAEGYNKQTYRTGSDRVDSKPTKELSSVKQYVLGIDLREELTGRSTIAVQDND